MAESNSEARLDFIRQMVVNDLKANKGLKN
jgi:hypothetical protein